MGEETDIVKQIFLDYDHSLQIKDVSRSVDGYSKSVYFITFLNDSCLELVLKFTKPGDNTEVAFYQLLQQHTNNCFPVPKVFKYNSISRNYYISSKLSGLPLSQLWDSMTHSQRLETYRALGIFNQQFHRWKDMFGEIITKQTTQFKGTMFEELADTIYKYLIQTMHLIDYEIAPRLLHMDLHCGNILMVNTKITGILDAADALIGHNEYELMRIEKGHFEENENEDFRNEFMATYTGFVKLDDGYEERRQFYSLSRELVGLRCLMEYGENYAQDKSVEEARKHIEDKVKRIVKLN